MPTKEWVAHHGGHEIKVVNTWTGGTRLYINGDLRDSNNGQSALDWTFWLSARIVRDDPASDLIVVYVKALWSVDAEIRLNGHYLAGEKRA